MAKLAIKGGKPLRGNKTFPKWPIYDDREMKALERVLKSGVWSTRGPEVQKFEKRFAEYQGVQYGVAVTNGTVTLEIILRALGIGYGDEVIVPPYTFIATASAVMTVGAAPVFVDIESNTYNIDSSKIEEAITPRTRAIIPVHIGGRACDMDKIMEIAKKHNLYVIEDCAHAHGSEWKGKRVGSIGDAGSFSFQSSKNLNSGEGGFITTNNLKIFEKCWSIHHCGRDVNGTVWYGHVNIGTNARMTEWQAAILDVQMDRLDEQIERRMENARYLTLRLNEIPCIETFPYDERVTRNSYHLYLFKYHEEKCKGLPREEFIKAVTAEGVRLTPGYSCLYKQPIFSGEEFKKRVGTSINYKDLYLENVEKATTKEGIWFTQNMLLGDKSDMDDIADAIIKVYENVDNKSDKLTYSVRQLTDRLNKSKCINSKINENCEIDVIDARGGYIMPGLIDIHTHGGAGSDVMDATEDDLYNITRFHASHGVTTMLPTTLTAPMEDILRTLEVIRKLLKKDTGGSRIIGAHMEGPYLSCENKGAHPAKYLRIPENGDYKLLFDYTDVIRTITVAPELPGADRMIKELTDHGIIVAGGHDTAIDKEIFKAIECGMTHTTHAYCVMSSIQRINGRKHLGLIEVMLLDDRLTTEIIADNIHTPPLLVKLIFKCKRAKGVCIVSDSLRAAGMPKDDKLYVIGSRNQKDPYYVVVDDGVAKLPDRSLNAGSITNLDKMLKNLVHDCGISITDAVRMATLTPAEIIRINTWTGSIEEGKIADICITDKKFKVLKTIVSGKVVYDAENVTLSNYGCEKYDMTAPERCECE